MDDARRTHARTVVLCLILALGTLLLYLPTVKHDFINLDDKYYVANPHVIDGFDLEDISWAFTNFDVANWHPLTWISHLIDVELFGVEPSSAGSHHFVNILFHMGNTLLLFFLLSRMTHQAGPSFAVAALFAVHPLHVESVAWISERKDVLSAFFGILAIGVYRAWTNRPSARRYAALVVLFACSLMAKSMLVTLPCVLLLLDYWPLGRLSGKTDRGRRFLQLVYEKLPLFAMSAAVCVVTVMAQSAGQATTSMTELPLGLRIGNALVSYVAYLGNTFLPIGLAPLYPHPGDGLVIWKAWLALALLGLVTAAVVGLTRRAPYAFVGWFWFVGTLVPVIGLIQVGDQAMADRYTYFPLIGLFIVIVWGVLALCERVPETPRKRALLAALTAVLVFFSVLTWKQISYWKDSVTLFEHTLAVTENNAPAHLYLGMAYHSEGRIEEAAEQYDEAIRISPVAMAHLNLGSILMDSEEMDEAKAHFDQAIELDPTLEMAYRNLGTLLFKRGEADEAIGPLTRALDLKPDVVETHYWLARAYEGAGRRKEALKQATIVAEIRPNDQGVKRLLERLSKTGD